MPELHYTNYYTTWWGVFEKDRAELQDKFGQVYKVITYEPADWGDKDETPTIDQLLNQDPDEPEDQGTLTPKRENDLADIKHLLISESPQKELKWIKESN